MSILTWIKSTKNEWLPFESFSGLENVNATGVYIIWHGGQNPRVVYVGQGNICARLMEHRNDRTITAYNQSGPLFVTWAEVRAGERDGVERFLADRLKPLIGDRHPYAVAVPVNMPWAA